MIEIYEDIKPFFQAQLKLRMKFIMLINVKIPSIVGILTSMSMINAPSESLKANKRALEPWVAHLRMTVYKGIGTHSSTQNQCFP